MRVCARNGNARRKPDCQKHDQDGWRSLSLIARMGTTPPLTVAKKPDSSAKNTH